MTDWSGLLGWSTSFNDGTAPSSEEMKPMSKEDREWLTEALHKYTFNDTDKLKEMSEEIKQDLESGFTKISEDPSDYSKTQEIMDRLMEICELHERNNLNICLTGGL